MTPAHTHEHAAHPPQIVDTEWLRDCGTWMVSARLAEQWTLVGLFDDSGHALQAATQALLRLSTPHGPHRA